jgi:hypothetical protein
MINWKKLLSIKINTKKKFITPMENWRKEATHSLCELYYVQHKTYTKYGGSEKIDFREKSDFNRFMNSHMRPLAKHGIWEAIFPNKKSATSAAAIDEALNLLTNSKLVDRVYSNDIITVNKIVLDIKKKRAKYLDIM